METAAKTTALGVAERYFAAWNARDPQAVAAAFAEGGVYCDPVVPQGVSGPAVAGYAGGLIQAFPDLSFEIVSAAATGEHTAAAQWVMRGTNTGPLMGQPPTGATIALPGADFITVADGKVRAVQGYFDQRLLVEQLGLQAIVLPYKMGPATFGYAVHVQGPRKTRPGAYSVTAVQVRDEREKQQVIDYTRRIWPEMMALPGFISTINAVIGNRMFTITAWEDAESSKALVKGGTHKEAMGLVFDGNFAEGGMNSVWTADRLDSHWSRCRQCGRRNYTGRGAVCQCGAEVPQDFPYF